MKTRDGYPIVCWLTGFYVFVEENKDLFNSMLVAYDKGGEFTKEELCLLTHRDLI